MAYDVIVKGAKAVRKGGTERVDIAVKDGKIALIGPGIDEKAEQVVQADGMYVFPGAVDCHVHFNEPAAKNGKALKPAQTCWLPAAVRLILICRLTASLRR